MSTAVLINPNVGYTLQNFQFRPRIPSSILHVGTALHHAGHRVMLVDQIMEDNWKGAIDQALQEPELAFVGISTMTGGQIRNALEMAEYVRPRTDKPIVWGGIHPTLLPEQTLENELVDVVVRREGEETVVELMDALTSSGSLDGIRGVSFRDNGTAVHNPDREFIDLDAQPIPNYDLLDMNRYAVEREGYRSVNIATTRGCPFNCGYCFVNEYHKGKWRARSAEHTLEWIRFLIDSYGYNHFWLDDEEFFIDVDRAREVMLELKPLGIRWKASIRLDSVLRMDDELLDLLFDSGCYRLSFGVESGSNRLLKLMNKRATREDAIAVNRRLAEKPMFPRYNFMMGFPTESYDELKETVSLAWQMKRDNPRAHFSQFFIFTPYPGCDLYDRAVELGMTPPTRLEQWAGFRGHVDNTTWLANDMSRAMKMLAFASPFLNEPVDTTPSLPVKLLGLAYRPIARQRIRHHFYRFPLEISMAKALRLYDNT